jgi:NAD(P)-dependent dehydrogenase (short-subunit alcohol dehydrogenase family)
MGALVYGGRSPIALAVCSQLAREGHSVHLVTRQVDAEIQRLGTEYGCTKIHRCDLTDGVQSVALAEQIDKEVGGLRAVAFVHRYQGVNDPENQYSVEVLTPYRILEALCKISRETECAVVLTTSPAARSVLLDQGFQYHASKAAISELVRYGSVRFADRHIRVNGVSPGSFVFKERAAHFYAENPEILKLVEQVVPLSRMAVVDEIASVVAFLLGDQSRYVNGQIIEVDGGISCVDGASLVRTTLGK